jgi:hypothetical protein
LYPLFHYFGFAVVLGALLVKSHRINLMFNHQTFNSKGSFPDWAMLLYYVAYLLVWCILLTIWMVIPSLTPKAVSSLTPIYSSNGNIASYHEIITCDYGKFNFVLLGLMALSLLIGIFYTYIIRNVVNPFNESRWISFAIYNW